MGRRSGGGLTALFMATFLLFGAAPTQADAQASDRREAAERELKRTLTRLCIDYSSTNNIDFACRVYFDNGVLVFEEQLNRASRLVGAGGDETIVRLTIRIDADERSYFVCGEPDQRGLAPLFVSCGFEDGANGPQCVEQILSRERSGQPPQIERTRQPIAKVVDAPPQECEATRRALNSLVTGQRAGSDRLLRDPG